MSINLLFYLILFIIIAEFLLSSVLRYFNSQSWKDQMPEDLKAYYTPEQYQKASQYHRESARIGRVSSVIGTVLLLLMLCFGGFGLLDEWLRQFVSHPILLAFAFFGVLAVVSEILGLPFQLYSTFVIEEKYGFNKTTPKTFISDKIKGLLLGSVIGGGLLAVIMTVYASTQDWFWLIAWGIVTLFSLFMATFVTTIFVPMFNKLSPLDGGELRKAIETYAQKVNFPLKKIFVMDGSKRSTRGNAFFSGLGSNKSIVLFDTLIEKHSTEELVAVLAHEVGHYKKKHIPKTFIISTINTGIVFFILGLALARPELSAVLGGQHSFHLGMLSFGLLFTPISLVTGIFMNLYSRKNEYEADAYAKSTYAAEPMMNALKKLSVDNLSNLKPHPAFVFFYYSHPTVLQRLAALRRNS